MGQFVQKYARPQNLHILIFMPATPHSVSQRYEHCQSLWTEYTCVHDRPFSFHPREKKKHYIKSYFLGKYFNKRKFDFHSQEMSK